MLMVLDKNEALAIYKAIQALASVGAVTNHKIEIDSRDIHLTVYYLDGFGISENRKTIENYPDIESFRKAYKLRKIG